MEVMNCRSIQVSFAYGSLTVGDCTDKAGRQYLDLGAAVGYGLSATYVEGSQKRNRIDPEARFDIGIYGAGQVSNLGNRRGGGLGVGGFFGGRVLVDIGGVGVNTRPTR